MTAKISSDLAHKFELLKRREARTWQYRTQVLADTREEMSAREMRGDHESVVALRDAEQTLELAIERGVPLVPVLSMVAIDDREVWQR